MKNRNKDLISAMATSSFLACPAYACRQLFKNRQKLNSYRILFSLVLAMTLYCPSNAKAATFDSMDYLPDYNQWNAAPWSWGVPRYQLYFSQNMLNGYQGVIDKITFFGQPDRFVSPITYDVNIYISSTSRTAAELSTTNLEDNHGADKTLVFSGKLELSYPNFVIDVDNVYNYTNNGNLLLDFCFNTTSPQDTFRDGDVFGFQAYSYYGQSNIARTYTDLLNGPNVIQTYSAGALRTQIDFTTIPEPATLLLFGLAGLALRRKR
jgi:hypothetical protein